MAENPFLRFATTEPARVNPNNPFAGYSSPQNRQEALNMEARMRINREREESPILYEVDSLGRQVARGVPVIGGALDEVSAAIAAATGGDYDRQLAYERQRDAMYETERPVVSMGAQLAGGVAGTVASARAGVPVLGGQGSLLQRAIVGGGVNAVGGGVDGFLRTDGNVDASLAENAMTRAGGAARGALVGGTVGAAVPVAGATIGAGYQRVREAVSPLMPGTSNRAVREATQDIFQRDGLTPAELQAINARLGNQGMLADVGPNTRNTADAIGNSPGQGRTILREAVGPRSERPIANQRVRADLDAAMGRWTDANVEEAQLIAQRKAASDPLYRQFRQAYGVTPGWTKELQDLAPRLQATGAFQEAERRAAAQGIQFPQAFTVGPNGQMTLNTRAAPDFQAWDVMQRTLRGLSESARRGGDNDQARIFSNLQKELVKELDRLNPVYRQARQAFAGPSGVIDALEEGRNIFSREVRPSDIPGLVRNMTPEARMAFERGVRDAFEERLGTMSNGAAATRQSLNAEWTMEKVRAVFGPARAEVLERMLKREETFQETGRMLGGSPTQPRSARAQELGIMSGGDRQRGPVTEMLNVQFGTAVGRLGDAVLREGRQMRGEGMARELAEIYAAQGSRRDALTQALINAQARQAANRQTGRAIGDPVAGVGGLLAARYFRDDQEPPR
jgi:hypothetical protein